MAQLKVTQIKSAIGTKPNQRQTLRSLGLKRITTRSSRRTVPRSAGWSRRCRTWSPSKRSSEQGNTDMTLKVHHLRPAPGAHTKKTRVGRGEGSQGQDRRSRHQGLRRPRAGLGPLRGWPDPAAHAAAEALGLHEQQQGRLPGREPGPDRLPVPAGRFDQPGHAGRRRRRPARSAGQGARHGRAGRRAGARARARLLPVRPGEDRRCRGQHHRRSDAGPPAVAVRRGPGSAYAARRLSRRRRAASWRGRWSLHSHDRLGEGTCCRRSPRRSGRQTSGASCCSPWR